MPRSICVERDVAKAIIVSPASVYGMAKKSFALRAVQSVRDDKGLPNQPGRALLEVLAC
jgi:hypothetical protein